MENKKQFVILSDYDVSILESKINDYIEKGYYPLGNIVIAPNGRFILAMQKCSVRSC